MAIELQKLSRMIESDQPNRCCLNGRVRAKRGVDASLLARVFINPSIPHNLKFAHSSTPKHMRATSIRFGIRITGY